MNTFHGVEIPDNWKDPKFVETVDGCFTMQVRDDSPEYEMDQKHLQEKSREVLMKLTGQDIIPKFQPSFQTS